MSNELKRIIISGGGTGGHIFPALAIAGEIKQRYPNCRLLFIGAEGRMEMERVPAAGYEIVGLPVKGMNRRNLLKNISVLTALAKSLRLARRAIERFNPQAVVGVGGYAAGPTLKVAQMLRIPTLIQEQNSYAGVTNKLLSKHSDVICVAYPSMEHFFPEEKIVFTGNPIRREITAEVNRQEALDYFGLAPETSEILLVVGGSLGARTINRAVAESLPLVAEAGIGLIWQTGKTYIEEAKHRVANFTGMNVSIQPFIGRMDYAYSLADLVISRSGACALSEICLLGKPSILVPSPNVAEDHQTKNAKALSVRHAAMLIPDSDAREDLIPAALTLLRKPDALNSMSAAAGLLAKPLAVEKIVDELEMIIRTNTDPES